MFQVRKLQWKALVFSLKKAKLSTLAWFVSFCQASNGRALFEIREATVVPLKSKKSFQFNHEKSFFVDHERMEILDFNQNT